MKIDFKREDLPNIKSIKYNYVFNGKKCSFMLDEIYLSNYDVIKTVVFNPAIMPHSPGPYYTFCSNIIHELIYKISRKEIKPLDTISIEVADDYHTFSIINSY